MIVKSILLAPTLAFSLSLNAADTGAEIKKLLATQAAAWNRGDVAAFCAVYVEDALFLTPTGMTRGRREVLARYQKRYPDAAARGTLSFEVLEVRVMPPAAKTPASASVAARWKLSYADKPEASGLTLLVLVPAGGSWKILQDASM